MILNEWCSHAGKKCNASARVAVSPHFVCLIKKELLYGGIVYDPIGSIAAYSQKRTENNRYAHGSVFADRTNNI